MPLGIAPTAAQLTTLSLTATISMLLSTMDDSLGVMLRKWSLLAKLRPTEEAIYLPEGSEWQLVQGLQIALDISKARHNPQNFIEVDHEEADGPLPADFPDIPPLASDSESDSGKKLFFYILLVREQRDAYIRIRWRGDRAV